MRRLLVALLALAACGGAVAADGGTGLASHCRYRPGFDSGADVRLARVKAGTSGRSYFFRDDAPACPLDRGACRRKAFVVSGDLVLVDRVSQGWACAWFAGANGSTMGYLAAADLAFPAAGPDAGLDAWVGEWERVAPVGAADEASASIGFSRAGDRLRVVGSALWVGAPGEDGNRMVNTGELGGFDEAWRPVPVEVRVEGASAVLAAADEDGCAATFRRVGPWLLADDNLRCGGLNVSFAGAYRRVAGKSEGPR